MTSPNLCNSNTLTLPNNNSSGSGEGRRELDEPRTVDGVEKVVLGEMFDERMISSAEAVEERQEDNMPLGHLLCRGAMT